MREVSCRCGKNKRSFKNDIGPFYIDDCCLEAGYDQLGNKVEEPKNQSESKAERKAREKAEREAKEARESKE